MNHQIHQTGILSKTNTDNLKQFRLLRNSLFLKLRKSNQRIVLVSSPIDEQGKSFVASNLAVSFASQGTKTLLIDANFPNPVVAQEFEVEQANGLTDLKNLAVNVKDTSYDNLFILPAGTPVEDQSALFMNPVFSEKLRTLSANFGIILIDGGSILHRADTQLLATLCNYLVLVINHAQVKKSDFISLQSELEENGVSNYGVVFNELPENRKKYDF